MTSARKSGGGESSNKKSTVHTSLSPVNDVALESVCVCVTLLGSKAISHIYTHAHLTSFTNMARVWSVSVGKV